MKLVIDASVALKWFLPHRPDEQFVEVAQQVADIIGKPESVLYAPPHWKLEVLAVLARTEPQMADEALEMLDDMAARIVTTSTSLEIGIRLATQLRHHLFDTLYHAVAMEMEATLVTADDAYYEKAAPLGNIMRLADYPA